MTEGRPLGLIISFAVPLLLGNLLQQTYNMMDAAIVGRYLGPQALAGVGASSSVQFLVLGFCMGICAGFGIPFATYFGAEKLDRMRRSVFNAAFLALVFSAVLTVVCTILCGNILHLMKTPADIYDDAYIYLFILFLGIPFSVFYNFLSSMMRAIGDSRTPFIFLAVSTVLNICLDLLFIMVFSMGCAGAAAATVTAQAISAVLCLVYIIKKQPVIHLKKTDMKLSLQEIRTHFIMGIPMGLQYSVTAVGCMVMQSANNSLGSIYVYAFTAASKVKQFAMCPFDALATGVSVFCSQNIGAGRTARAKEGIIKGVAAGVSLAAAEGAVMVICGRTLATAFISSDNTAILDGAAFYLKYIGFFFWLIGILNVCRMSVQGLGYSVAAVFSGVIEMAARIAVSRLFVPEYGFTAISLTDQAAWLAAVLYVVPLCAVCIKMVSEKIRPSAGDKQ